MFERVIYLETLYAVKKLVVVYVMLKVLLSDFLDAMFCCITMETR